MRGAEYMIAIPKTSGIRKMGSTWEIFSADEELLAKRYEGKNTAKPNPTPSMPDKKRSIFKAWTDTYL